MVDGRWSRRIAFGLAGWGWLAACAAGPEGGSGESLATTCAALCGAAERCWPQDVDEASCVERCVREDRWSEVGLRAERRCYERLGCRELQVVAAWRRCVAAETAGVAPAPEAEAMCAAQVEACRRCLGDECPDDEIRDECLAVAAELAPAYAVGAERCYREGACDRFGTCERLLRYSFGG
jgi:hypothetical protein